jgi:acetamidase/formamidase
MTLQSGEGLVPGEHYLTSTPDTVLWGFLPNRTTPIVLDVQSGASVTIDTISHEGLLEDQGRDPVAYFTSLGVTADDILDDQVALARSGVDHRDSDGPHVVTGPIAVEGARPGDLLRIEVGELALRAGYGVVSNRHGRGALSGELPRGPGRLPDASAAHPERYGTVSTFMRVDDTAERLTGVLPYGEIGRIVRFPLNPFLGIMGTTPNTDELVPSIPPGLHGGNIDVNLLESGAVLYLPVAVPGAGFYVGDPHYAQGDGEVALTALEAPLRATLTLSVVGADAAVDLGFGHRPFIETDELFIPIGLDADLNEAMRDATRAAIGFLIARFGMREHEAYAYLSAAADFEVSQVVDQVKGVHCCIRKSDFV